MKPKTIIVLVLILLISIIHVQNTQVVTLHLLFWQVQMSQIVLMFILLALGFIFGFLVAKLTRRKSPALDRYTKSPNVIDPMSGSGRSQI